MRRRVVRVAVVAVAVALTLLAIPLGWGIQASFFADERGELERMALAAAVRVGPQFASGDDVELPSAESDGQVGVYDRGLRLRAGRGPASPDRVVRRAIQGGVSRGSLDGELVVGVPVSTSEQVIGAVRASAPTAGVWHRVLLAWLALAGAASTALGVAVAVARRQSRALSAPLEALSGVAVTVAAGDLTARAQDCGIAEIDDVARAQNVMVARLGAVLAHERRFSANASHQLRTPLTGLQLGLEAASDDPDADLRMAVQDALRRTRHLERTVEEVLDLSRLSSAHPSLGTYGSVTQCLDDLEHRWHGVLAARGRRMSVVAGPETGPLRVTRRATDQVLDVLVDNASDHGRGTIAVHAREVAGAVAIDVSDEGTLSVDGRVLFHRGVSGGTGHGIGLALARDITESLGGRLSLSSASPTTFTMLLPGGDR